MRILVTGASGFVAPYAARSLKRRFPTARLVGASRGAPASADFDEMLTFDICDASATLKMIESVQPTHVLHLAGIAAPGQAASDPELAWRVNVFGTVNIARAVMTVAPDAFFAHVSSGLVYGGSARAAMPLTEASLPEPLDEYGVTKMSADLAIGALANRGLRALRLRPFNHTGPGQDEAYVVPAFAMQIARIEAGRFEPVLHVGNLEAKRDFLDVRDVADAYTLAIAAEDRFRTGTILNVASGRTTRIRTILDILLSHSSARIRIEEDPLRMRPSDVPTVLGNADRANQTLGWRPRRDFNDTLAETLDDCRRRVGQDRWANCDGR